jgi:hypothetical protein
MSAAGVIEVDVRIDQAGENVTPGRLNDLMRGIVQPARQLYDLAS